MGLLKKFGVECLEGVKHVAANVDEVVDADGLKVVHASGGTCYYKFGTTVEILECCGSEFGIFVVA